MLFLALPLMSGLLNSLHIKLAGSDPVYLLMLNYAAANWLLSQEEHQESVLVPLTGSAMSDGAQSGCPVKPHTLLIHISKYET